MIGHAKTPITVEKKLGISICWAIWKARNAKVFENKNANLQGVLTTALYWYNLYFNFTEEEEMQAVGVHQVNSETDANTIWKAPVFPTIKINVDAAWKDGEYTCAAVERDSTGSWCGVGAKVDRTDTVVYAEADGLS
ncbi:uncharacterized protein LOC113324852 [Papaver somniferum]|uniref:uncharacterized protein LOC113324852 n=1 Tax=Papaver somniferum TaxID=3469 RepID=UPI000E6FE892|nr:uncharacterized protein LOC113324852 [Papaver somniferum]